MTTNDDTPQLDPFPDALRRKSKSRIVPIGDDYLEEVPTFGVLAGGRSYLRRESLGRAIRTAGANDPIVLDPQDRYGDPFDASRFLREMANDLLGPGVLDRDGDKLTTADFDKLDAALDIAEAAMMPGVDGMPVFFDPMATFGDVDIDGGTP